MLAFRTSLRYAARFSAAKKPSFRPSRRLLTAESEAAAKPKAGESAHEGTAPESSRGRNALFAATLATFGVGYAAYEITEHPEGELAQKYQGSAVEGVVNRLLGELMQWMSDMHKPQLDQIMDDWPYPGYPAGTPCPPVLLLDVEKTILGSEWDSKYGWRHAVRPGLHDFLKEMSMIFEIVLITENDAGSMVEMLNGVKGTEFVSKIVGNTAMRMQRGTMLKDLSIMNRPIGKILVIDDNPKACKLCEDNTIYVKPFTNLRDKKDNSLMELVPLLQALYLEQKLDDIPGFLRSMHTHDGHNLALDYDRRLNEAAFQKQVAKRKGLGGLLRGGAKGASELSEGARTPRLLPSATDVVGAAPTPSAASNAAVGPGVGNTPAEKPKGEKKAGGLLQRYRQMGAEEEERQRRKVEKMNEVFQRRELEKQQRQQQQQQQQGSR